MPAGTSPPRRRTATRASRLPDERVQHVAWAPLGITLGWSVVPAGADGVGLHGAQRRAALFYFLVLLRGYRKADLTVVYPLARGSGPLLSSLVAVLLLGEKISRARRFRHRRRGARRVPGGRRARAGCASHDPVQRERVHKGMATACSPAPSSRLHGGRQLRGQVPGCCRRSCSTTSATLVRLRDRCPSRCATARPPRACGASNGSTRCWWRREPGLLRAGAVRGAAGAALARGAGARGVDAVRRADRRPAAARGRPPAAPAGRAAASPPAWWRWRWAEAELLFGCDFSSAPTRASPSWWRSANSRSTIAWC
jgi:hypothetical protein